MQLGKSRRLKKKNGNDDILATCNLHEVHTINFWNAWTFSATNIYTRDPHS